MHYERVINEVINKSSEESNGKEFSEIIKEWKVDSRNHEDTKCICGKDIIDCYYIKNLKNNKTIGPLGNICIKKFNHKEMFEGIYDCKQCNISYKSSNSYDKHIKSEKHLDKLDKLLELAIIGKKCLDCETIISEIEPKWKVRCLKCYMKRRNAKINSEIKINL